MSIEDEALEAGKRIKQNIKRVLDDEVNYSTSIEWLIFSRTPHIKITKTHPISGVKHVHMVEID